MMLSTSFGTMGGGISFICQSLLPADAAILYAIGYNLNITVLQREPTSQWVQVR